MSFTRSRTPSNKRMPVPYNRRASMPCTASKLSTKGSKRPISSCESTAGKRRNVLGRPMSRIQGKSMRKTF